MTARQNRRRRARRRKKMHRWRMAKLARECELYVTCAMVLMRNEEMISSIFRELGGILHETMVRLPTAPTDIPPA